MGTRSRVVVCALLVAAGGSAASAVDTIMAKYDVALDPGFNVQAKILNPVFGPPPQFLNVGAAQIDGRRQDLPAGPGVNPDIPLNFPAFCIEISSDIDVSVGSVFTGSTLTHNVYNVLGGTTDDGGISGPITFGINKTRRLERLWGSFYNPAMQANLTTAAAFQIAIWEISYEAEAGALDVYDGLSEFSLFGGATASGNLANAWLATVDGAGPQTPLYLLVNRDFQDLITPVPAPAAAGIGALAMAVVARRRRTS